MRRAVAVFFFLLVAVAVNGQDNKDKISNLCKTRKSNLPIGRPIRDPKNCRSSLGQYKCAVFYKDLPRKRDRNSKKPLSWIGGLPDALRKEAVKNNPDVRATFGNLEPRNFWYKKSEEQTYCTDLLANSRCYVAMQDPAERKLDECEVNIINDLGDETLGDLLCDNLISGGWVDKSYAQKNDINNIDFGFYYSACGGPWKAVSYEENGKKINLEGKEKLCCTWKNNKYMYKRCDGSPFDTSAKCKA